jgi:hypothetical protein
MKLPAKSRSRAKDSATDMDCRAPRVGPETESGLIAFEPDGLFLKVDPNLVL